MTMLNDKAQPEAWVPSPALSTKTAVGDGITFPRPLSEPSSPHNIDAEQSLLGAILIDNAAYLKVADFLTPDHFFDPVHARIFGVVAKAIQEGSIASPITLQTHFNECAPVREGLSVARYLGTLAAHAVGTKYAAEYGKLILQLATRRRLVALGQYISAMAIKADVDVPTATVIDELRHRLEEVEGQTLRTVSAINLEDFLARNIVRRSYVVEDLLHEKGLAMVYAWRGAGKTWFVLGLGFAIATGGSFLKWNAKTPKRVVHVCGEMPADALKERLTETRAGTDSKLPAPDYYRIISADLLPDGLPDLATVEGQTAIERAVGDAEVVILDNVSTLFRLGAENEAESWLPVQTWLLKLRRQGRTVIVVHHAGKSKTQRGTSRREDILDLVLALKRPPDADPTEGARFEVHFEKYRGLTGTAVEPFDARLIVGDGRVEWTTSTLEDSKLEEILELKEKGLTIRAIAEQLGMSKSTVGRVLQRA